MSKYSKIATLTEQNDHIGAYLLGAQMLGNARLETIFRSIQTIHNVENEMSHLLMAYRYSVYQDLMKYAKHVLSPKEYAEFYQCF